MAILFVMGALFAVPPENLPLSACAFHTLTGYSCLTCGLTRSLHAMLHGDLIASLKFHAAGPILFLLALMFMLKWSAESLTGKEIQFPWKSENAGKITLTLAVVWLLYWGARFVWELMA